MSQQQIERDEIERFRTFFRRYYRAEISRLAQRYPTEQRSLAVTYGDLAQFDVDLAERYVERPAAVREMAEEALRTVELPADVSLGQAHVRVWDLDEPETFFPGDYSPTAEVGSLRALEGEVSRATEVYPRIVEAAFECQRCGTRTYVPQTDSEFQEPHECQGCERQGPFRIDHDQSAFVDAQTVELQKPPEYADGEGEGIEIDLEDDLCGTAEVGDRVVVTGQLRMRQETAGREKTARFEQWVEAHHVHVAETDHRDIDIDAETRERVHDLVGGVEGDPLDAAAASLAPKIHGYEEIKRMAILALVGGSHVGYPTGDADRGTVNVLLLGDPGTAKSKIVERVEELGWRTVGVSGKGATTAGVTATAVRDEFGGGGGEWTLKAGALVRANGGTVAIDELDDMPQEVRAALLEPMSKQHINVTKGGINTKLRTRTAVVAAGNPTRGRFDPYEPIHEQFPFESNLTSRFDLIFTVSDRPDPAADEAIAEHILTTRDAAKRRSRSEVDTEDAGVIEPPVAPETLRAWIALAKRQPDPVFESDAVRERIKSQFTTLRGLYDYDDSQPVPVTFRKLEAVIRIAEAAARFEFSPVITERHAEIATQAVGRSMREFDTDAEGNLDADVSETGSSQSQREKIAFVRDLILDLEEEYERGRVPRSAVIDHFEEILTDQTVATPDLSAANVHGVMDKMQEEGMAARHGADGESRADGESEADEDTRIRWLGQH
jgi:replicative DNA helicase Mcm